MTADTWPRWMTVTDVARYIGRTEKAVRALILAGKLPAHRPDGRVLVDRHVVDAWVTGAPRRKG